MQSLPSLLLAHHSVTPSDIAALQAERELQRSLENVVFLLVRSLQDGRILHQQPRQTLSPMLAAGPSCVVSRSKDLQEDLQEKVDQH